MVALKRSQLHRWVWRAPVSVIASEVGVTAHFLTGVFNDFRIPRPARGVWRQIEVGQQVAVTPLDDITWDPELPVEVTEEKWRDLGIGMLDGARADVDVDASAKSNRRPLRLVQAPGSHGRAAGTGQQRDADKPSSRRAGPAVTVVDTPATGDHALSPDALVSALAQQLQQVDADRRLVPLLRDAMVIVEFCRRVGAHLE